MMSVDLTGIFLLGIITFPSLTLRSAAYLAAFSRRVGWCLTGMTYVLVGLITGQRGHIDLQLTIQGIHVTFECWPLAFPLFWVTLRLWPASENVFTMTSILIGVSSAFLGQSSKYFFVCFVCIYLIPPWSNPDVSTYPLVPMFKAISKVSL